MKLFTVASALFMGAHAASDPRAETLYSKQITDSVGMVSDDYEVSASIFVTVTLKPIMDRERTDCPTMVLEKGCSLRALTDYYKDRVKMSGIETVMMRKVDAEVRNSVRGWLNREPFHHPETESLTVDGRKWKYCRTAPALQGQSQAESRRLGRSTFYRTWEYDTDVENLGALKVLEADLANKHRRKIIHEIMSTWEALKPLGFDGGAGHYTRFWDIESVKVEISKPDPAPRSTGAATAVDMPSALPVLPHQSLAKDFGLEINNGMDTRDMDIQRGKRAGDLGTVTKDVRRPSDI